MTKGKRLDHLKKIRDSVENHQIARELDLEMENIKGLKGLDQIKAKDQKNQFIQEHKNYLKQIKEQIETDKLALDIIDKWIDKLEKEVKIK